MSAVSQKYRRFLKLFYLDIFLWPDLAKTFLPMMATSATNLMEKHCLEHVHQ
jgi:hypothetical protein